MPRRYRLELAMIAPLNFPRTETDRVYPLPMRGVSSFCVNGAPVAPAPVPDSPGEAVIHVMSKKRFFHSNYVYISLCVNHAPDINKSTTPPQNVACKRTFLCVGAKNDRDHMLAG